MSQSPPEDPVLAIIAEKHRLRAAMSAVDSDDEMDALTDQVSRLDNRLIDTEPTSVAGVLAGLEEAKYELTLYPSDDDGRRIILSRIDAAIRLLKEKEA
jgi:hypothetical protein